MLASCCELCANAISAPSLGVAFHPFDAGDAPATLREPLAAVGEDVPVAVVEPPAPLLGGVLVEQYRPERAEHDADSKQPVAVHPVVRGRCADTILLPSGEGTGRYHNVL